MSTATDYISQYSDDRANINTSGLMTALEEAGYEGDQDWEAGATTWKFGDESAIQVEGNEVSVFGDMPNSNEEGWFFVGYSS